MRYELATDPVYAPNSKGGPRADTARYGEPAGWHTDGEMVRTAYALRAQDDDWGQAGTPNAEPRFAQLVADLIDELKNGREPLRVSGPDAPPLQGFSTNGTPCTPECA